MAFMFRLLSAKLDIKDFEKAKDLDEVIRMTYTFIDREIDKGLKEGRKEGEFNTVYNFIKQGLVTIEQADRSIGITKEQLLEGIKEYHLVL